MLTLFCTYVSPVLGQHMLPGWICVFICFTKKKYEFTILAKKVPFHNEVIFVLLRFMMNVLDSFSDISIVISSTYTIYFHPNRHTNHYHCGMNVSIKVY